MNGLKVISCVTSDLISDQRVHRFASTFQEMGCDVLVIGRRRKNSGSPGKRLYRWKRITTFFEKGPLFYFGYNFRLFFLLFFKAADVIIANDLDSLPACALVCRIRSKFLIYDSHEYFTEVPELTGRPFVKSIWKILESIFITRVNLAITVSHSIAIELRKKYGIEFHVVRNLPESYDARYQRQISKADLSRAGAYKVIVYQGSVNVARGLEEMLEVMEFLPDCLLYIFGEGDVLIDLKKIASGKTYADRIVFMGRLPMESLAAYTVKSDLGISLEKDIGLSYRYSLPNKVFDYIQAGIPAVLSALPEMISLNEKYKFGVIAHDLESQGLAGTIRTLLNDKSDYERLKQNAEKAAKELNWSGEKEVLRKVFAAAHGQWK